jgi:hypothetical protein
MKRFLRFARISAAIAGGVIVVFLVKPIAALISGEFTGGVPPATAGRTVYEISANVVALLMLGFLFGVLHGWTFGLTSLRQTAIAATVPVFLLWVFFNHCDMVRCCSRRYRCCALRFRGIGGRAIRRRTPWSLQPFLDA